MSHFKFCKLFGSYTDLTGNVIDKSLPIPASITSPGTMGPTPAGDPVRMTSPGSRVMYSDI